ncbi:hypothetical protein JKF63_00452 [Porcisia hertigi]|uniref:Uncharacterized protein n=1 Tax=Porcisia hertigi TaxID=2761500 RepID=A0A836GYC0_9TRYP|nr:hypothetical protein JKF63_00452 [Porcisia hertigi]
MKTATILGAGELGKACACALAANGGVSSVTLLTRDVSMVAPDNVTSTSSSTCKVNPEQSLTGGGSSSSASRTLAAPSTTAATPWPSVVDLQELKRFCSDSASLINHRRAEHPLFLCTPSVSYLSSHDPWARAALGDEHCSTTHDMLTMWRSLLTAEAPLGSGPAPLPGFVAVFTRGFAADGAVPSQLAEALLNGPLSESSGSPVSRSVPRSETPVLVASGPLLAKEWALQSTPRAGGGTSAVLSSSSSPRPPGALSETASADRGVNKSEPGAVILPETCKQLSHAFSGVALTFAAWTPSVAADSGRQKELAEQLRQCFPRESVTYLTTPDAAALLAIVNGCVPLCSFGAGLVSSVYTGTSVTSLAAYAQHAVSATEKLVNELLGRAAGTPLPLPAVSTLWFACTCLVSREFALGRKLDFYFRKQDALEATFRGQAHHLFAATVDGLHTRMLAGGVTSPFYEVLMDTYNTTIRASRVGEGLVKEGYYDYRDTLAEGSGELLRHVTHVDQAMLSGDETQFKAAKERIMQAFAGSVF